MMHERAPRTSTGLRGTLAHDAPLARHTSWRAGGPRRRALRAGRSRRPGASSCASCRPTEPVTVLGPRQQPAGARRRRARHGGRHAQLRAPCCAVADGLIYAEAGVASPKLARFAAMHGCADAEFLAGIPGTVGGALAMNAGCYGGETWRLRRARRDRSRATAASTCARPPTTRSATAASGRADGSAPTGSSPPPGSASRRAIAPRRAMRHQANCSPRRIATQPLALPNAGSVFRNPPGDHAARLIEACGLKGFAIGGARVSDKHANFIVNPQRRARAADIEALIVHVRDTVRAETGVDLEPEVRIIGEAGAAR